MSERPVSTGLSYVRNELSGLVGVQSLPSRTEKRDAPTNTDQRPSVVERTAVVRGRLSTSFYAQGDTLSA
jgi:hypothetical protein